MEYILAEKQRDCFLCSAMDQESDREGLVLYRGQSCFTLMNRYPYNNGHCMVVPYRHVSDLTDLTEDECLSLMLSVRDCKAVLQREINADGFNVGINLGKAAGAGLEEHLHVHIVPRWSGDTNFMPVTAGIKVMPQDLYALYDQLLPAFAALPSCQSES